MVGKIPVFSRAGKIPTSGVGKIPVSLTASTNFLWVSWDLLALCDMDLETFY